MSNNEVCVEKGHIFLWKIFYRKGNHYIEFDP